MKSFTNPSIFDTASALDKELKALLSQDLKSFKSKSKSKVVPMYQSFGNFLPAA
jgi:hypothetical protein